MPTNPFTGMGKNDPLAPSGGTGAWGNGTAGFGNNAGAYAAGADEYDVVEIEEPAGKSTVKAAAKASGGSDKRERELARKEAELQKREADIRRQEELLRRGGTVDPFTIKNFPRCMPIVHHDISHDIPEGKRSIMRQGFFIYLTTVVALLYNLICVLVAWIDLKEAYFLSSFFFALIYFLVGVPLAWILWYMRLYRAMMRDGALAFGTFFIFFIIHIAFAVYTAVSPEISVTSNHINFAHAGLITALKLNSDGHTLPFIFYIAGFCLWTALSAMSILYMARVYATFRNNGGVAGARQEATVAGVQMVQSDLAAAPRGRR